MRSGSLTVPSAEDLGLLGPVGAQVEHGQLREGAEPEPAVERGAVAEVDGVAHPDRHPLVVGAAGPGLALEPVALGGGLVVLGAGAVGVVGGLVVVPGDDERGRGVQRLEVVVALVLRVPLPVVGQRDDLVRRHVPAHVLVVVAGAVLARGVLVEVVAEVDHRVEVVAPREVPVGGEVPGLQVRAGHHAEAQVVRARGRGGGGPGAPDRAREPLVEEPVVVRGPRAEPGRLELHGVVAAGARGERARGHHVGEAAVAGDLPAHGHARAATGAGGRVGGRREPGPQDDAGGVRVAGGDAVAEVAVARGGRLGGLGVAEAEGQRAGSGGTRDEQGTTVDLDGGHAEGQRAWAGGGDGVRALFTSRSAIAHGGGDLGHG